MWSHILSNVNMWWEIRVSGALVKVGHSVAFRLFMGVSRRPRYRPARSAHERWLRIVLRLEADVPYASMGQEATAADFSFAPRQRTLPSLKTGCAPIDVVGACFTSAPICPRPGP